MEGQEGSAALAFYCIGEQLQLAGDLPGGDDSLLVRYLERERGGMRFLRGRHEREN